MIARVAKPSSRRMNCESQKREAVQVKICGITNLADAKLAASYGADAVGFNFYPKSPRRVGVLQAREIIRQLPSKMAAVGVFVNAPAGEVLKIARRAKLRAVQLHGNESPETVARLARYFPVIKAFRVGPSFDMKQLKRYRAAAAFLLDGYHRHLRGGTGETFSWGIARTGKALAPLILAGGLTAQNVRRAIRAAGSSMVDVCSGVESLPRKKDAKKVREFLEAVGKRSGKLR